MRKTTHLILVLLLVVSFLIGINYLFYTRIIIVISSKNNRSNNDNDDNITTDFLMAAASSQQQSSSKKKTKKKDTDTDVFSTDALSSLVTVVREEDLVKQKRKRQDDVGNVFDDHNLDLNDQVMMHQQPQLHLASRKNTSRKEKSKDDDKDNVFVDHNLDQNDNSMHQPQMYLASRKNNNAKLRSTNNNNNNNNKDDENKQQEEEEEETKNEKVNNEKNNKNKKQNNKKKKKRIRTKETKEKEEITITTTKTSVDRRRLQELVNPIVPTKLTKNGQIDWDQYDTVYFQHTRKAGGTTVMKWSRGVAWKHNKTFIHAEGYTFHEEMWKDINIDRVLFLTVFRPPLERTISGYTFDENQQQSYNRSVSEYIERCDYMNNVKRPSNYDGKYRRGWVWVCASECYSKWFGPWPTENNIPNTTAAIINLNQFEIIWMKHLNDIKYQNYLIHRYNASDVELVHHRKTPKERPKLNNNDIEQFKNVNTQDQILYDIIRNKWQSYLYNDITNNTLI